MKELRAVLFGLRRRVRRSCYHRLNHLFLCDNLGVVLALEKGRAHNRAMLMGCRKWASYLLCSFSRARVRWIASEVNPTDEPSRWFEPAAKPQPVSSAQCHAAWRTQRRDEVSHPADLAHSHSNRCGESDLSQATPVSGTVRKDWCQRAPWLTAQSKAEPER